MKKHPHKIFKTTIIIVVLIVIIATGLYFSIHENAQNQVRIAASYPEIYTDSTYHFTVRYSTDLSPNSFANPSKPGEVVLLQNIKTGMGMQVVISPFAADTAITADFIKKNIPSLALIDPRTVVIGNIGNGVSFLDATSTSANRQVWFTEGGNLYQVTAPATFDASVKDMLDTWTWSSTSSQSI